MGIKSKMEQHSLNTSMTISKAGCVHRKNGAPSRDYNANLAIIPHNTYPKPMQCSWSKLSTLYTVVVVVERWNTAKQIKLKRTLLT